MDTLIACVVAFALTLFFVRGYLAKLTASRHGSGGGGDKAAPQTAPGKTMACPRCAHQNTSAASFCSSCGTSLTMYKTQQPTATPAAGGGSAPAGIPQPVINASLCVGCGSCIEVCPETGTLELVNHKAVLAHADRCKGHASCKDACPTNAISMAVGGVLQTVKLPDTNEFLETNVKGMYIAGELGGFGLIKVAINEGRMCVDHIRGRIEQDKVTLPEDVFDVAIVGAGAAGLSASLSAHQYGLRYVTLEQGEIASTIRQYPRQKFLMAEPLEMPLIGNLYIADGTKEALLEVWESIVRNTGVKIRTNERVENIQRNEDDSFVVRTNNGEYKARFIVLAVGKRGTPRKLDVPGEELSKVTYRLIEAETYEHSKVVVVGGGDSAIEAALALGRDGRNDVTLVHRRDNFERARERNRNMLKAAVEQGHVKLMLNSQVAHIDAATIDIDNNGKVVKIPNDFVFVLAGGQSPDEFLKKLGIQIVEKSLSPLAASASFT